MYICTTPRRSTEISFSGARKQYIKRTDGHTNDGRREILIAVWPVYCVLDLAILQQSSQIFLFYLLRRLGCLKKMRACFVVLLLLCISLMCTGQENTTTTTTKAITTKTSGSENSVVTLATLVMTLVTVFIFQAKDWFC
ncbi:hypothetical protein CHS0354_037892 [Potamilus streckersoni]|uniref:Uncharacterized protein n=1 Tax=Potamilus streckersoni TaxID=2493646 RepID=A0AAE0TAC4_9BIVA|nr:hypothetical protein CHS0354_037892 [Potamilus streckersoni]